MPADVGRFQCYGRSRKQELKTTHGALVLVCSQDSLAKVRVAPTSGGAGGVQFDPYGFENVFVKGTGKVCVQEPRRQFADQFRTCIESISYVLSEASHRVGSNQRTLRRAAIRAEFDLVDPVHFPNTVTLKPPERVLRPLGLSGRSETME